MAPREGSTSRHRESGAHRKHGHRKKSSRDHSSRRQATESEATSSGAPSSSGQKLSLNALSHLNEHSSARPVEETPRPGRARRKKERRPREDDYIIVEPEDESPRVERRRKREYTEEEKEARRAARRERRRREAVTDDERELRAARRERRRKEAATDSERDYDAPSRERRRKGAVTDSERDYKTPKRGRHFTDADTEDEDALRWQRYLNRGKQKKRLVSGAIVEEGRASPKMRGGAGSKHSSYDSIAAEKEELYKKSRPPANKKKRRWIIAGVAVLIIIIVIVVAVVVSKKNASSDSSASQLNDMSEGDIPTAAQGTYLDPFTWYTTTDFNVTYTNETVGDLPVMGLYTSWDDSAAANDKVPALDSSWGNYSSTPARGVNLGGWLSLEPFITPSLFDYDSKLGIIDEWTLCNHLGAKTAASTLEKHYATFVTEDTFSEIADAGLDHVRIPYSYWAVITYDDDPYVFRTSWRYLLRGIEWARKHGLRVNLDLHALPGSQNGWNHSGRQGEIRWLNGTDGDTNRQRSLDVHDRLSKFFAQDRYKNIVTFYGLANEPRMVNLDASAVISWTTDVYKAVRANGITANIVFGDGFMGLENWQGKLTNMDGLVLDVHQYVIFNNNQIIYTHKEKVTYACDGWTQQTQQSLDTSTGYGPTMFAEWSQADTDCAESVTNVGWGNRWEGTFDSGNASTEALTPRCPTTNSSCSCTMANADVGTYTDEYKKFLLMFAEAQMTSFEYGWGWWYWTWDTESAPLWSYKQGLAAGTLPAKAYDKSYSCDSDAPDFASAGLSEFY
ncbi:putative Glycoside hydrolase family 5 domain-containing protein [Seiridium cardinale]|uniref:glucan 1,3-beta-glucosidase n=1 Tax=Seiridium cardinale TaxID=138064 RepID=A0ABR2Y204_9PEZI